MSNLESLLIVLIFVLIWITMDPVEKYKTCRDCSDDIRMLDGGMVVKNPYVWPYSGTEDIDKIYQLPTAEKICYGFSDKPLIHMSVPDNVILT